MNILTEWRKAEKISQEKFAAMWGKTQPYVSRCETNGLPDSYSALRELSSLTGHSIDELADHIRQ